MCIRDSFSDIPTVKGTYNPTLGAYTKNSTDVLIPAFLAAYTGKDVNTVSTNPFLSFLSVLPNWRMNYDGLSRIGWVKDNFKSISLTHAYTCRYSFGNYTSFSSWVAIDSENKDLGFVRDVQSNNPIPSSPYDISSVSLNEQFSPLIGINAALKNSMTTKFEYRKQRNMALNLSSTQLIEATSDEFVAVSYTHLDVYKGQESARPPHRLLLGNMAYDLATAKLEELRKEFVAYEAVARGADFPKD